MAKLGFVVNTLPDGRRQKVRDDGRRGLCVADEAVLWDALEQARRERDAAQCLCDDLRKKHETRKAKR